MYEVREDMWPQKYRIRFTVTQRSQRNTSPRTWSSLGMEHHSLMMDNRQRFMR